MKTIQNSEKVTGKEKLSYGLYFMGQNIFFGIVGMMTTYFTDIGIAAATVAVVALITKVWDAINDPIFGMLMDKIKFKRGKFIPWLRISLVAIPLATIFMFVIPSSLPMMAKAIWATIAYMLWDTAYTICDVPIFGLVATMTNDQNERLSLNSIGRLFAIFAGIVVAVGIPMFRQAVGGWGPMVIILSIIGTAVMIPICFFAKERVFEQEEVLSGKEENYTIRDMALCIVSNKYLLIFFSSSIVSSLLNVGASWGIYLARYCYGGEEQASVVTLAAIIPTLLGAAMTPVLCRKFDKFKVIYASGVIGMVINVIKFIAGYQNFTVFLALSALGALPGGVSVMLLYQFTPDCYEYAQYKTGLKLRGVTFAAQTFFIKLGTALSTAISTFALTFIGFVEGEGAVQAVGFADKLWNFSNLGAILGGIATLVILSFYKLNDHDVQLMAKYNVGEITREEAESQMKRRY